MQGWLRLPRRYAPRNGNISPSPYPLPSRGRGKKIDSRVRGNDMWRSGNDKGEKFFKVFVAIGREVE